METKITIAISRRTTDDALFSRCKYQRIFLSSRSAQRDMRAAAPALSSLAFARHPTMRARAIVARASSGDGYAVPAGCDLFVVALG